MARPLRIQAAGLAYHITARGVRRMNIFLDDDDRRRFLEFLAGVVERYGLRCHAYCEMTNHYHLALTTTEANLSRAMKQLNGNYAQWWNSRHTHVGHVFQSRFDAQVVQDTVYLQNVCRYVVLNPVRAGMVVAPEHWQWSSYRATIGLDPLPPFIDCDRLFACVSPDDPADGPRRFRRAVLTANARSLRLPRDAILGDDAFVARFQPQRAKASREVPRREGRRPLAGLFRGVVTRKKRDAAIVVAVRAGYPMAEVARYLEMNPSTVSRIISTQPRVDEHGAGNAQAGGQTVKNVGKQDLTPDGVRS